MAGGRKACRTSLERSRTLLRARGTPRKQREGAILVLIGGGIITLLLFAAIAVDLGFLYYTRTRLNQISTAAAQAGYEALVKHRFDYNANKDEIIKVIEAYMKNNGATSTEIAAAEIKISPRGQVTITMSSDVPMFFARVDGFQQTSTVEGDGLVEINNIAPFAVPTTYHDPDQDGIANWKEEDQSVDLDIKTPWKWTEKKPYIVKYGRVEGMARLLKNHVFIPMDDEEHWVPLADGEKFYLPPQDFGAHDLKLKSAARKTKAQRASLMMTEPSKGGIQPIGLLRAYGVAYDVLGLEGLTDAPVNWLLGYAGGSFLISEQALSDSNYLFKDITTVAGTEIGMLYKKGDALDASGIKTGVRFVRLNLAPGDDQRKNDISFLEVLEELRAKEKIKALQITYQPKISTFTEGEDHVTQGMFQAGIPFTAWFLDGVLPDKEKPYVDFFVNPATETRGQILNKMVDAGGSYGGEFDWLHVHHEDFASPYVTDTEFLDTTIEEIKEACDAEIAKRVAAGQDWGCDWEPQTEWYLDNVDDADGKVNPYYAKFYTDPYYSTLAHSAYIRELLNNYHLGRCAMYRDKSCSGYESIEDLEAEFMAAQTPYTKANLVGAISDFVKVKHKFLFAVCWANEHLEVSLAQLGSKTLGVWDDAGDNSPQIEGGKVIYDDTFAFEHFQITKTYLGSAEPWNSDTLMGEVSELNDATADTTNNESARRYYLVDYLNPLVQNHLGFRHWELEEESGAAGDIKAKTSSKPERDYIIGTKGRTQVLRFGATDKLHSTASTLLKKPVVAARGETIPGDLLSSAEVIVQSAHADSPRSPSSESPGFELDSDRGLFYISGIGDDDGNMKTGFGRWAYLPGHDPHRGYERNKDSWREWVEACVGKTYDKDRDPRIYEWHSSKHGIGRNLDLDGQDVAGYYKPNNKNADWFRMRDLVASKAKRSYTAQALPECGGADPLVDPLSDIESPTPLTEPWCCDDKPAVPPDVEWVQEDPCYWVAPVFVPEETDCREVEDPDSCVETKAAWTETIEGDCYAWYSWPEKGGCGGMVPTDGASCPKYYPAGEGKTCPAERTGECTLVDASRCDADVTKFHPAVIECGTKTVCETTPAHTIDGYTECPDKVKIETGGSPAVVCERVTKYQYYGPWTVYLPDTEEYKIIALPGPNYDKDQTDIILSGCLGVKGVYQERRFKGALEGYRLYLNNILFGSTVELSAGGNSIPNSGAINPAGLDLGSGEGEYGDTKSVSKNAFSAIMFIGTKGVPMPVGAQFRTAPGDNVETAEAGMDNMTNTDRDGKSNSWEEFQALSSEFQENHRQILMVPVVERIPQKYEDLKGKGPAEQERILNEFFDENKDRKLSIYGGDMELDPGHPDQAQDLHIVGYAKFFIIDKGNQVPTTQDSGVPTDYVATEWRKGEIRGYFLGFEHEPPAKTIYPATPDADPR